MPQNIALAFAEILRVAETKSNGVAVKKYLQEALFTLLRKSENQSDWDCQHNASFYYNQATYQALVAHCNQHNADQIQRINHLLAEQGPLSNVLLQVKTKIRTWQLSDFFKQAFEVIQSKYGNTETKIKFILLALAVVSLRINNLQSDENIKAVLETFYSLDNEACIKLLYISPDDFGTIREKIIHPLAQVSLANIRYRAYHPTIPLLNLLSNATWLVPKAASVWINPIGALISIAFSATETGLNNAAHATEGSDHPAIQAAHSIASVSHGALFYINTMTSLLSLAISTAANTIATCPHYAAHFANDWKDSQLEFEFEEEPTLGDDAFSHVVAVKQPALFQWKKKVAPECNFEDDMVSVIDELDAHELDDADFEVEVNNRLSP